MTWLEISPNGHGCHILKNRLWLPRTQIVMHYKSVKLGLYKQFLGFNSPISRVDHPEQHLIHDKTNPCQIKSIHYTFINSCLTRSRCLSVRHVMLFMLCFLTNKGDLKFYRQILFLFVYRSKDQMKNMGVHLQIAYLAIIIMF